MALSPARVVSSHKVVFRRVVRAQSTGRAKRQVESLARIGLYKPGRLNRWVNGWKVGRQACTRTWKVSLAWPSSDSLRHTV
jgi:hypothetical protein